MRKDEAVRRWPFISLNLPPWLSGAYSQLAKAKGYSRAHFFRIVLERALPFAREIAPKAARGTETDEAA